MSAVIAYRRRWFLEILPDGTTRQTRSKIDVPVALCWTESEVRELDTRAQLNGPGLLWESVPIHNQNPEVPSPSHKILYVRFNDFAIDMDNAHFWQLVDPIPVEAYLSAYDVQEALSNQGRRQETQDWDWENVIKFRMPWRSEFLFDPFTVNHYPFSNKSVKLNP